MQRHKSHPPDGVNFSMCGQDTKLRKQCVNRRWLLRSLALVPFASITRFASAATDEDGEPELFPIAYGDVKKVGRRYRRRIVEFPAPEPPGTIVIDVDSRFLYLTLPGGRAYRYGIGVGKQGFEWSGTAFIRRKAKWPRWIPPKEMVARDHLAAQWADGMPGGPDNPLGARALYLYQGDIDTLYRIHGTSQPQSIGRAVSSGCIRLLNADVADLYERVPVDTKVIVRPSSGIVDAESASTRSRRMKASDR